MTIATLADYKASLREYPIYTKTAARTSSHGSQHFSFWDATGSPSPGSLSIGNTSSGVVPTDATTGAIPLNFSGTTGYLTQAQISPLTTLANVRKGRFLLYDRLWHGGNYSSTLVSLTGQPSYASRLPGGNYAGTQIWAEMAAAVNTLSVTVTYTNDAGVAGQTTGAIPLLTDVAHSASIQPGQMFQLPLASGDSGVQKIESVQGDVTSSFNIVVIRPLWWTRIGDPSMYPNTSDNGPRCWMDRIGLPVIYTDSCLAVMSQIDAASVPSIDMQLEIASK